MHSGAPNLLLPEVVLIGYRNGFFPMGDGEHGAIHWHRPNPRAIIPLNAVHISKSLQKVVRQNRFSIRINTCFHQVIHGCAARKDTWITNEIIHTYEQLHHMGYAHSVEAWLNEQLVGGLYGVSIGGAFFGESMFSIVRDASKVTFVHLTQHLNARGFSLLDTQYINEFTESLGAIEIPDSVYSALLADAVEADCAFD